MHCDLCSIQVYEVYMLYFYTDVFKSVGSHMCCRSFLPVTNWHTQESVSEGGVRQPVAYNDQCWQYSADCIANHFVFSAEDMKWSNISSKDRLMTMIYFMSKLLDSFVQENNYKWTNNNKWHSHILPIMISLWWNLLLQTKYFFW